MVIAGKTIGLNLFNSLTNNPAQGLFNHSVVAQNIVVFVGHIFILC